ncbi:centrosomal protein of 126 kDa isoform X2 [Manis pentadactyla]|uniref:centrosomal protein of 126 kDa isoform X2 n=1 Tax=Manis pentadactyla TaxID=143292 RepID=UPI00255C9964|nr:centrosomal protein of 126 kDa isoform X2 [Manis pentadactyla]
MLAARPGARSAGAGLGPESSEPRDRARLGPRGSGGGHRLGAYLDMKTYLEKNLEEERQILLQQQKICRNRARKYFVESNRRKKVFEEKQKEQEEREHQIREQILQQRKQEFLKVTEKFQRAHIPLSQRKRAAFQKPVPPLEEALRQIQESNSKSEVNLPSSHRPTISWRAIDNALPSSLPKNDHKHQKHLLSKINCVKEMKENSRTNLATNKDVFQLKLEETQKLLEDQHLSTLQKFCDEVKQITNYEALSSIDSLEAGEHEEIYLTLKEHYTSIHQNSVSLRSANLQSTNVSCFDEDKLSFSKTQHINNWLINLDDPNNNTVTPFSDILSKPNVVPSCECLTSKEQNPSVPSETVERATNTTNNSVAFVYSQPTLVQDKKSKKTPETGTMETTDSFSGAFKGEKPLVTESQTLKFSKAWTTPDSLTQEMATFSDQEKYSKLTQENRTASVPATLLVPAATPLVFTPNTQSARPLPKNNIHIKEIDPVQCTDQLGELKEVKDEKVKYFNCSKANFLLFSDDFQAPYIPHNSDSKDKKQKIAETSIPLSNVISDCDLVGQHKKIKYNIHERNGVRFLKSILKKESKYEHDCFKALVINQGFKLGTQKATAIRDSIELTKEKGKGAKIPKTLKKLRWFDETGDTKKNTEDNYSLKNRIEISQQWSQPFHIQTKSSITSNIISVPACAVNSADRKEPKDDSISANVTTLGGPRTDHVLLNCFIPSSDNIAKQAWPSSEKEENKSPLQSSDSKIQKANSERGGTKVIRRTRSAKVQSGFLYTNRKGTVIRPQSASKANTFLQAQSKLIVPHPPPKYPSNIRNGKNIHVAKYQSVMPENSQNMTQDYFNSSHLLPVEHRLIQQNQESSFPLSDICSDLVTEITSLPYCASECQTLAKINHSNGIQKVAQQHGTLYYTQRSPVYEENNQSVTLRTTEEESVPLWKRLPHNILSQNEKAPVSDSTSEFLMAESLVKTLVPENEILTVMNSNQLQKSDLALHKTQPLNICALSIEEQKILQSLNHLNERLQYVQETICKKRSMKNTLQTTFLNSQPRTCLYPDVGSRLQRKY